MRRSLSAVAACCLLALAGCGGSHHHVTSSTTVSTSTTASPTPALLSACHGVYYVMQCAGKQTATQLPQVTPTTEFGVDFEGAPSPTLLHRDGVRFAVSYLSGVPGKDWTRAQLLAYHAAGIQTSFVFERAANDASRGCGEGLTDARAALSEANALGAPSYTAIPLAVDEDVSGASVQPYFSCAHQVLGAREGVYGSYRVVTYLIAHGLGSCRTDYQTIAWSFGQRSCAGIYQYSINDGLPGIPAPKLDFDRSELQNFGQWPAPAVTAAVQHYARYPNVRWRLRGQRVRERLTVQTWDRRGCRNPAQRPVCKSTSYHLRLLLGRDQRIYRRDTARQRNVNHLPGRIQGLTHRLARPGVVSDWL